MQWKKRRWKRCSGTQCTVSSSDLWLKKKISKNSKWCKGECITLGVIFILVIQKQMAPTINSSFLHIALHCISSFFLLNQNSLPASDISLERIPFCFPFFLLLVFILSSFLASYFFVFHFDSNAIRNLTIFELFEFSSPFISSECTSGRFLLQERSSTLSKTWRKKKPRVIETKVVRKIRDYVYIGGWIT